MGTVVSRSHREDVRMDQYLVLKNIEVINANAISGLTYGFPSITHFLGYVKALSRKLTSNGIKLSDVGVICHSYDIQVHRSSIYEPFRFGLTLNPLTRFGDTAPINEEGRMSMKVSLMIRAKGINEINETKTQETCELIKRLAEQQKLAGGRITSIKSCYLADLTKNKPRDLLRSLMPGFVLIDRSDLMKNNDQGEDTLTRLLDYCSVQYQAMKNEQDERISWYRSNQHEGYIVPIVVGYKAIAPLQAPGVVANARDTVTPTRFVETVLSLGEWIGSPSRIESMDQLFWRYEYKEPFYVAHAVDKLTNLFESESNSFLKEYVYE